MDGLFKKTPAPCNKRYIRSGCLQAGLHSRHSVTPKSPHRGSQSWQRGPRPALCTNEKDQSQGNRSHPSSGCISSLMHSGLTRSTVSPPGHTLKPKSVKCTIGHSRTSTRKKHVTVIFLWSVPPFR